MTEPARCRCHLPLDPTPPDDQQWWWPERAAEPGPHITAVVRYGARPELYRIIRVGDGWLERGQLHPKPWREVGLCWAGHPHLVVATTIR